MVVVNRVSSGPNFKNIIVENGRHSYDESVYWWAVSQWHKTDLLHCYLWASFKLISSLAEKSASRRPLVRCSWVVRSGENIYLRVVGKEGGEQGICQRTSIVQKWAQSCCKLSFQKSFMHFQHKICVPTILHIHRFHELIRRRDNKQLCSMWNMVINVYSFEQYFQQFV